MGEWRTVTLGWASPPTVACRLCGRPLFGRAWSTETDGSAALYCEPGCEALFHEYWLPRYGDGKPPQG